MDHFLAKHKIETAIIIILITVFIVYIATRSVAQSQTIPACFTVSDQISAPPCAQGSTVAETAVNQDANGDGDMDDQCICTVAPVSIGDIIGLGEEGAVLFLGGGGILSQDTSATLFWNKAFKRLGIGTNNPQQNLSVVGTEGFGISKEGTWYTIFKAQSQNGDITYLLPESQGAANTVLTNNGSGSLSWAATGGGVLLSAERTLTPSDIDNLQGTNIRLLSTPDAGKYYTIFSISASRPDGTPYGAGVPSNHINLTQGGFEIGLIGRNILTSATGGYIFGSIVGGTTTSVVTSTTSPVLIGTRTDDIDDSGGFSIKIKVWYTINDLI